MIDLDLAQATFEYLVRKKRADGDLPDNEACILCTNNNCYYVVDWQGVIIHDLWKLLVDESTVSTFNDDELESYLESRINYFKASLKIVDPKSGLELKLSDINWIPVEKIPKNYFRK